MTLRQAILAHLGVRLSDPTIGDMLALVERARLREQGVVAWIAREALA